LDFRSALVIEESEVLRRSIVEHIKIKGWIVHGVRRVEHAVLQRIPYHLIVIDSELPGMTAIELARIIHESRKGQATWLVIISGSPQSSVAEFTECGGFLVGRSAWREELSKLFSQPQTLVKNTQTDDSAKNSFGGGWDQVKMAGILLV